MHKHYQQLKAFDHFAGISIWCQTGGWHAFRRLTFLENSSPWVELNCQSAIDVIKHERTPEQSIEAQFPKQHEAATAILEASEEVIRKLFYIRTFAQQELFFRRVRIPTLLHLYWDRLFISNTIRTIIRFFTPDPLLEQQLGQDAFAHYQNALRQHASTLPEKLNEDLEFMHDTAKLILLARTYFLTEQVDESLKQKIRKTASMYRHQWNGTKGYARYKIQIDFNGHALSKKHLTLAKRLLIRTQARYRFWLDHVFTLPLLKHLYRLLKKSSQKSLPSYAQDSAMGIESVLK